MKFILKNTNKTIESINKFFDTIEDGILIFKEAVNNYVNNRTEHFDKNFNTIKHLEGKADSLRREIETAFYKKSLIPQYSADIVNFIEEFDDIIDYCKENINQFRIEKPEMPEILKENFILTTDKSVKTVEMLLVVARDFFHSPELIRDNLNKVYFYERETDKEGYFLKEKLFSDKLNIDLCHKIQLQHFSMHIEKISDKAEEIADLLNVLSIKMSI